MKRCERQELKNRKRGERIRENAVRRRKQELHRKIFVFCLFTFLLGVLFGKIVFAKERENLETVPFSESDLLEENSSRNPERDENIPDLETVTADDWKLTLVNASCPMEEGYVPKLSEIENNYYFDARAVSYLQKMLADGRKEGLDFWVCSAYRTIEKQTELYEDKVRRLEMEGMSHAAALSKAGTEVARPGTSEHSLGLAVDIVARDYQMLDEKQEKTKEQQWLMKNCWKYGFILRYPPDKTEETGIIYEPWHYRYVGKEAAKEIMEQGICLEEYLGKVGREYE